MTNLNATRQALIDAHGQQSKAIEMLDKAIARAEQMEREEEARLERLVEQLREGLSS